MEEEDSLTMSTYEILPKADSVQIETIAQSVQGGISESVQGGISESVQGGISESVQGGISESVQGGIIDAITMTSTEIKAEIMNSDDIWQCVTKPPKPLYPAPILTPELTSELTSEPSDPTPAEPVLEPPTTSILRVQVDLMEEFQLSSGIGTIGFHNLPEALKHGIEIIERLNWQDSGATKKYFVVQLLLNLVKTSEEIPSENVKAFYNFISAGHVDGLIDLILAASKGRLRVNQQPLTLFQRFIARCCFFFRRENYTVNK